MNTQAEIIKWQDYIHSDEKTLLGKPTIKNTRLSVEFILGLFAAGWTVQQILDNYPTLKKEQIFAVFAFVHDCMKDELLFPIKKTA
ncbi:MAG: DUF433 domain-containing protein [Flavobacteriales bacterium]